MTIMNPHYVSVEAPNMTITNQHYVYPSLPAEDYAALQKMLERHEGMRLKPYTDSTGHLTIGVGRNLGVNGISPQEAYALLTNDINCTLSDLARLFPGWGQISFARQVALADMAFNLGAHGVLGFYKMVSAIKDQDWVTAAKEVRESKWRDQVGARADDIAYILETDKL